MVVTQKVPLGKHDTHPVQLQVHCCDCCTRYTVHSSSILYSCQYNNTAVLASYCYGTYSVKHQTNNCQTSLQYVYYSSTISYQVGVYSVYQYPTHDLFTILRMKTDPTKYVGDLVSVLILSPQRPLGACVVRST